MGGYDSLAGIMQTFAVNYISNASLIVLVQQSAIPISMLISKYALNSTYSKMQYVGSSIVLFGIIVVLVPNFLGSDSSNVASTSGPDPLVQLIWLSVLVISCVPMCLSSVYKEKALGEVDIDIIYLNGWVAIFQFLIAIPLCIPTSQVQNIPISEILPNMYDGFKCWMGINSVTAENNPYQLPLDDCSLAPLYVNTYLFFNVIYNFLIVVILKLGSANILYMASTVIVPLSNVVFSLKFIQGSQPLRKWDIIGLLVIMTGLIIYRFNKEILSFIQRLLGTTTAEDLSASRKSYAKKLLKDVEIKQLKYLGLNQMESLQTLVDVRIMKEQSRLLFKSPQQIRGNLYNKIGIPPSPLLSIGPGNRLGLSNKNALDQVRANYRSTGVSPHIYGNSLERTTSFRNTPKSSTSTTASYLTKSTLLSPLSVDRDKMKTTYSYGTSGSDGRKVSNK
eukprot:CAMPEP_0173142518 /NCGR_PEP_ID=MMETSP1105-20130129/6133_1 /TAXON_ID=2985 /ORGANISM="Ochromonas sp., Strain BG-1" /LENGTH=448 /DNA_ID=CAMNT_0014055919 /DNA_START=235 /DNA_END=1581 /DNA_ORIENTATION=-